MVLVVPPPSALSPDKLTLFWAADDRLGSSNILVFYGPSATATSSGSRIQTHIFAPAGFQSYPRLTISPSSPLYAAVECLPREDQGDEICRGLAFSLFKYFAELPENVKDAWRATAVRNLSTESGVLEESHAAELASRMVKVEDPDAVILDIERALCGQSISWLDVDVVLPPGSMQAPEELRRESIIFEQSEDEMTDLLYGEYAPLINLFGSPIFLPSAKLQRAPSRPTAVNRTMSFSRKQKESIRRELCEFLDTEESYVSKIYDLVHSVAADFRERAKAKSTGSSSPGEQALKGLFPPSLDLILENNSKFLDEIRVVIEETENEAIKDIESSSDGDSEPICSAGSVQGDVTGALAFAKCLLSWFPKFADCYPSYTQAHSGFSHLLKIFMKETASSFSKRVQETGEQRLMSMLIEPVQRLPRYNLYIDNIVKQLPARHPAVKPLLKSRDIISDICSQRSPIEDHGKVVDRLHRLLPTWPRQFRPRCRLIQAVDVMELEPPFRDDAISQKPKHGLLLLFADCLVLLQKSEPNAISSRGFLAVVNKHGLNETESLQDSVITETLSFRQTLKLGNITMTEVDAGKAIRIIYSGPPSHDLRTRLREKVVFHFLLSGSYEGKASRLLEEVCKARLEGRFSGPERESKWEVRSASGELGLVSAIYESKDNHIEGSIDAPAVQLLIDPGSNPLAEHKTLQGPEVTGYLTNTGGGFYILEIVGPDDHASRDRVALSDLRAVMIKRLSNVLQLSNQIRHPTMTAPLLAHNEAVLRSLKLINQSASGETGRDKFRPPSPVKLLSSLFGSSTSSPMALVKPPSLSNALKNIPRLPPPSTSSDVFSSTFKDARYDNTSANVAFGTHPPNDVVNPLAKLEETLAAYVLALDARKGNIVGKVLRARAAADELAVNEVYNALLEDPDNPQTAAEVSVDVLFAAFEKFIKNAWRDKMGPIVSTSLLEAIQAKSDALSPTDFEEYFRSTFSEVAPQNQRAVKAIIKLLGELLYGTSNDGDRGILTAAFAEVLVPEGDPLLYISLLDRFIEDFEALFGGQIKNGQETPSQGSWSSESRPRSANTGSISSNTSSLRRKFGFGPFSRDNSKPEGESKAASVWRSLSKASRPNDSQPTSPSKASLIRSTSTDTDTRTSPKRPMSRDRPTVLGAFSFEEGSTPIGKSFLQGSPLVPIGESSTPGTTGPPRKKRRSSLSDLKPLQSGNSTPSWSPVTPRKQGSVVRPPPPAKNSPRTPSPIKTHIPSPRRDFGQTTRLNSPSRKENSPTSGRVYGATWSRPTSSKSDEATTTQSGLKRRTDSNSAIPVLRPTNGISALSERQNAGNVAKPLPEKPTTSPRKLKMQSPQKLRERLQNEQKAISTASASLQAELSKISAEMTTSSQYSPRKQAAAARDGGATGHGGLASRLSALENKVPTLFADLTARTESIATDISTSLQVSEARAKKLDELYREASAENEALYARFNDELARIMRNVRAGDGIEEMKKKLREAQEEAQAARKDCWRLKRENIGLRAQLKGDENAGI